MSWLLELEERREPDAIPGKAFEDWLRAELREACLYYRQPAFRRYLVEQARRHDLDVRAIVCPPRTKTKAATVTPPPKTEGRGRPRICEGCRISACLSEHHSHGYCNNCYRGHRKGRSDAQLEVLADKRMARTIPEAPKPEVPLLLRNHPVHPLHARSKKQKQQLMEKRIIEALTTAPGLLGEDLRSTVTRVDDQHLYRSFGVALTNLKTSGIVHQDRDNIPPTYHLTNSEQTEL